MKLPKDVDRADREADSLLVDHVEVDQFEQRLTQRLGVVIAGGGTGAGCAEPRIGLVRREEAGLAERRRHERACQVSRLAEDVAVGRVMPDLAAGDAVPEDL